MYGFYYNETVCVMQGKSFLAPFHILAFEFPHALISAHLQQHSTK